MDDTIRLFAVHIAALEDPAVYEKCFSLQPSWRREKIGKYRLSADRRRAIAAGLALRTAFPDADLEKIVTEKYGRPVLPGGPGFNLSHEGAWDVCAAGDPAPGCDIEQIRPVREGLVRRVFTPREAALLESTASEEARTALFFRLWTLKESFVKATGEGIGRGLDTFGIDFPGGAPVLAGGEDAWLFREYRVAEGYACAVCAPAGARFCDKVEYIDPKEF